MKALLSSKLVLLFPHLGKPSIIEADASKYACGGILLQENPPSEIHPVPYFSRSFLPAQKWSARVKELSLFFAQFGTGMLIWLGHCS